MKPTKEQVEQWWNSGYNLTGIAHHVHFAELAAAWGAEQERKACAKVCIANQLIEWPTTVEIAAVNKCAAAIRNRSKA